MAQTHSRVDARMPKMGIWQLADKKRRNKTQRSSSVQLVFTSMVREYVVCL